MAGNWNKSFMAFQCQGCDKTFSFCIHFVLNFSWSFRKTTNWKKSCIDFVLDFSWSFRKNWKLEEIFYSFLMLRLWYSIFFLHWYWSWLEKKGKKSLIAFQRQGCDKMFSSWIHFVLIFYEASQKTGNWKKSIMALHSFCS